MGAKTQEVTKVGKILLLFTFGMSLLPAMMGEIGSEVESIYQDPKTCLSSKNESFSTSSLSCYKCIWTKVDPDSPSTVLKSNSPGCPCPKQYFYTQSANFSKDKCEFCPSGTVTKDQKYCVLCGKGNPYDNKTGECAPCPLGSIHVLYNSDGSAKNESKCVQCADGTTPSWTKRKCHPCHPSFTENVNGICKCPESTHILVNGICMLNYDYDLKNLYKIPFAKQNIESQFLRENVIPAYHLCKGKFNESACHLLANLCTLQLHSYIGPLGEEKTACQMYRKIEKMDIVFGTVNGEGIHPPNLDVPEAATLLQKRLLIPYQYRTDFAHLSSDLNISVARFSVIGEFLGLTPLVDIIPCQEKQGAKETSQKLGSTVKAECSIGIKDLFKKYEGSMEFLDAFLSHEGESDGAHKLYSIPIKIQNLQRNGVFHNQAEERYQWILVRRFFIVDTIGGFDSPEKVGVERIPKIVHYLESIHVRIQLQLSSDPGRIFIPLIILNYNEVDVIEFQDNKMVKFSFIMDYFMDMERSIEDVKIAVGVISALSVIWAGFQTWSWNRRNGHLEIDLTTLLELFITSCGHLADAFFIVCFATVLYWFVFFKKQVAVHVLLPQPDQEKLVRDLLIAAFALKIVDIIQLIWRQVNVDIFFVDWERPRARSVVSAPAPKNTAKQNDPRAEGNVSIWRTYFVANEWNEIQSTRKIHMASQIIISLFFLEILGFKHWGLHWPDGSLNPGPEAENVPYSTSARIAIGGLVFGITGICQWVYRVGFYERYVTNKIQDFVDICTLSNISVFILAAKQQGYYVHGRSVHGFADTDMQTMIEQLGREEEDLCGRRGLLPSTDQQTFLISVPRLFRSVYDQVLQPLYVSSSLNAALGRGRQLRTSSKTSLSAKPSSTQVNLSIHAYHTMNNFLTAFLEHALNDLDFDVSDKSFFERTFDMEFNEVGSSRAVFYNDDGHSFDSILFYGNERTLFMFNLYVFIFVDILSHDFILAGILTYFFDMIVKCVRNSLGRRNLARKTLIDSRFLI